MHWEQYVDDVLAHGTYPDLSIPVESDVGNDLSDARARSGGSDMVRTRIRDERKLQPATDVGWKRGNGS